MALTVCQIPIPANGIDKNRAIFGRSVWNIEESEKKILRKKSIAINPLYAPSVKGYKISYLSGGLEIIGFLLKPETNVSRHPVLIFNRGGRKDVGKISARRIDYLSYFCSKGYVILASQYRGNDGGQGREEYGGRDINDVLSLISLAKRFPFVDPKRIGMLGFSRGGMMTYLAIKNGVDIKAAAVVGGVCDLMVLYKENPKVMETVFRDLFTPTDIELKKRSASYWPEKMDVPLLIMHGEEDRVVNVNQVKRFAESLADLGKAFELVVFPGGNHTLGNYHEERDSKILAWFDKYLR